MQVACAFFVSQSQSERARREKSTEVIDPILIALEDRGQSSDDRDKWLSHGKGANIMFLLEGGANLTAHGANTNG